MGENQIDDAINELAWIIDSKANKIFHSIDNMTATTNLNRQINLEDFIRLNSEYKDYITYNPETFTRLFVRGKKGKAILFKNGKVVFVGCKDKRHRTMCGHINYVFDYHEGMQVRVI